MCEYFKNNKMKGNRDEMELIVWIFNDGDWMKYSTLLVPFDSK